MRRGTPPLLSSVPKVCGEVRPKRNLGALPVLLVSRIQDDGGCRSRKLKPGDYQGSQFPFTKTRQHQRLLDQRSLPASASSRPGFPAAPGFPLDAWALGDRICFSLGAGVPARRVFASRRDKLNRSARPVCAEEEASRPAGISPPRAGPGTPLEAGGTNGKPDKR